MTDLGGQRNVDGDEGRVQFVERVGYAIGGAMLSVGCLAWLFLGDPTPRLRIGLPIAALLGLSVFAAGLGDVLRAWRSRRSRARNVAD